MRKNRQKAEGERRAEKIKPSQRQMFSCERRSILLKKPKKMNISQKNGRFERRICKFYKKGIEILRAFVYNVRIVAQVEYAGTRPTVTEESKAFPKGD